MAADRVGRAVIVLVVHTALFVVEAFRRFAASRRSRPPRKSRYEQRLQANALLYRIVDEHLEDLCELAADRNARPLLRYVVQTFQASSEIKAGLAA